ncbi:MAG: hypothetical protein JXA10_15815, partial [Anaerolineae bacterium]|nr:hypothetical protein [Anaerolineae bacterium]
MTLRSQVMAALAVLFIGMIAVLALVGDAGVQNTVFSANPTHTPLPTETPVPTVIPGAPVDNWPSPDNWAEVSAGQYQYMADSTVAASLTYQTMPLESLLPQMGIEIDLEEAKLPLMDAMAQYRDGLLNQIDRLDLGLEQETLTDGPFIDVLSGNQVVSLRLNFLPELDDYGKLRQGVVIFSLVDRPDDTVSIASLRIENAANMYVEGDYWAWLDANMAELAGPDEEAAAADETEAGAADTEADAAETEADAEDVEANDEADT